MKSPWQRYFWRNVGTSYALTAVRFVAGILLFPMLFRYMDQEEFGFWSLLWGIVGYTVLVDFGMGFTATLEVARRRVTGDWEKLSRLLSTMLWSYVLIFVVIEAALLAMRPVLMGWIHISPGHLDVFSRSYVIFSLIIAVGFPLGIFQEVLRGLQRLDIVNTILAASQLLNIGLLALGVRYHWSFETMVAIGAVCTMLPFAGAYVAVRRLAPLLCFSPRLFSLGHLHPVLAFSIISYLFTIANLVIVRTDQVVISTTLGVGMIAMYQVGFKLSEIYGQAASQVSASLSQAAAHCSSTAQTHELIDLLVKSTRMTVLFAVPGFALGIAYLDPLIHFLTGLTTVPFELKAVAIVLFVARLSRLITHGCACPIFLGGGWERPLLKLTMVEAILNLAVSVLLARWMGIVGVALGTMVPAVVLGWLVAVPMTLRFARMSATQWFMSVYVPILPTIAFAVALLTGILHYFPGGPNFPLLGVFSVSALVMVPVLLHMRLGIGFARGADAPGEIACDPLRRAIFSKRRARHSRLSAVGRRGM